MGDFDRNTTTAKPNETRKLTAALVLGVVLIGLVAMQFMKHSGPQSAVGAPTLNNSVLPSPVIREDLSAAQLAAMIGDLQNDPTTSLLRPVGTRNPVFDAVPRNPFRISKAWLKTLIVVKPEPQPAVATKPAPKPIVTPDPIPRTVPIALRPADYKLTGILNGNIAVVNGQVVRTGAIIGRARVLDIHDKSVILEPAEFPGSSTIELSIQSALDPN